MEKLQLIYFKNLDKQEGYRFHMPKYMKIIGDKMGAIARIS